MEDIRTNLFSEQKNGYDLITPQEHALIEEYAADYMRYLDISRTEREAAAFSVSLTE